MPSVFGIPLIGFIQMVLGTGIIVFLLIKFLTRPKKNKKDEYIINDVHIVVGDGTEINDVHIVVGDGTEQEHQNVYIKNGLITEISEQPIEKKNVQIIDSAGKTLMPGLIDSHIHIQGGFSCHNEEESDVFLNERMPQIFQEGKKVFCPTALPRSRIWTHRSILSISCATKSDRARSRVPNC